MAYTIPTAQNLQMKFAPAFDNTPVPAIEFAIEEGAGKVDDSWLKDQALAILYYAAHVLTENKSAASNSGRRLSSQSIGPMSESYQSGGSSPGIGGPNSSTTYGAKFDELVRLNFSGAWVP